MILEPKCIGNCRTQSYRYGSDFGELWLDYQDDGNTLYIRLKEKTQPTRSEGDFDDGVVFDYEGEDLVGIEIMDITGQLKYATRRELPTF